MADLSLKIKSDFAQAEADFQSLAASSDFAKAKIEKFSESFKAEKIQEFTDKNRLAAIAAEATGGKLAGMQREAAGLKSEIERLIKNGLSPQDEKLKALTTDYDRLQGEIAQTTNETKKQESATVNMTSAMVKAQAIFAAAKMAFTAAANTLQSFIVEAAKIEDFEAAFTPLTGSAENAKAMIAALNKEASTTPFELEGIAKVAKQLLPVLGNDVGAVTETFRMLGDTAGGSIEKLDSITRGYMKTMLKGKVDMESLNMIAEAGVPIYKTLADSMGVTVAQMMEMSKKGTITSDDLTAAFQMMTSEGGIFFNGMEIASQTFNGQMSTFQDNVKQASAAIGTAFLPMAKEMLASASLNVGKFVEWANTNDNLANTLKTIGEVASTAFITIAAAGGVWAASNLILAASNGTLTVSFAALTVGVKAFAAAVAANPIGAIATVITLVLVPAIIYLIKNWDTAQFVLLQGFEIIKIALLYAAKGVAAAAILMFAPFLAGINLIIVAFNKLTGKNIPTVVDAFKGLNNGIDAQIAKSQGNIAALGKKHQEAVAKHAAENKKSVNNMNADSNSRLANEKSNTAGVIAEHEKEKASARSKEVTYKQILESIAMTELQKQNEMISQTVSFFEQRATLESDDYNARIAFLQQQYATLKEMDTLSKEERIAAEKGLTEAIRKQQQLQMKMYFDFAQQILSNTRQMFDDLAIVMKNSGRESRKLAMASRAVAIAEAIISAHLAAAKSLAEFPWPFNLIAAGVSYAAGAARVAAISSTPIPSAQTGGEFKVPDTPATRNDKAVVMASGGETVSVSPRGESGNKQTVINVQFDKYKIFEVVQDGIDTGQINISDRNLGTAVFA